MYKASEKVICPGVNENVAKSRNIEWYKSSCTVLYEEFVKSKVKQVKATYIIGPIQGPEAITGTHRGTTHTTQPKFIAAENKLPPLRLSHYLLNNVNATFSQLIFSHYRKYGAGILQLINPNPGGIEQRRPNFFLHFKILHIFVR
jgi:hypothetical protein